MNRNSFLALFSDTELAGFVPQMTKPGDEFYREEMERELEFRRQNGVVVATTNKPEVLKCLDEVAQTIVQKASAQNLST